MPLHPWIDQSALLLDHDLGQDLKEVVTRLTATLVESGRIRDESRFVADVLAREERGSTALPGGLGLPHARSAEVVTQSVAFARLARPISTPSGAAVDLVILLGAPADDSEGYLRMLKKVAVGCARPGFLSACRSATSANELEQQLSEAFK
jgi:PTS system fructose-specific IIC component